MVFSSQRAARIRKRVRTSAADLVQRSRCDRPGVRGLSPASPRALGPRPRRTPRSSASRGCAHPAPPLPVETQPGLRGLLSVSFSLRTPPSAAAARPPLALMLASSGIAGAWHLHAESSPKAVRGRLGSHIQRLRLVMSRLLHPHLGFRCRKGSAEGVEDTEVSCARSVPGAR